MLGTIGGGLVGGLPGALIGSKLLGKDKKKTTVNNYYSGKQPQEQQGIVGGSPTGIGG